MPPNAIDGRPVGVLHWGNWVVLCEVAHAHGTYEFLHEHRCGGEIVAILPYRKDENGEEEYLLREEVTPCWGFQPTLATVTGGVEKNQGTLAAAVQELHEETGYHVAAVNERWTFLGKSRGTKSTDTWYMLFSVDVSDLEPGEILGDGSHYDTIARPVWTLTPWKSPDPMAAVLWARHLEYNRA